MHLQLATIKFRQKGAGPEFIVALAGRAMRAVNAAADLPFATRSILDVPALFQQYGLADIWREQYAKAAGVVWLASEESSYYTAQDLLIDGGLTRAYTTAE